MSGTTWIISYNLKSGVSVEDFLAAAEKCCKEVVSVQKGFISWEMLRDGDTWIDVVKWETAEDAKNGETAGQHSPVAHEFFAFLDMESCTHRMCSVEKSLKV
ncbi:MAG: hypothetical protein FWD98_09100 [Defluviitaleaceae bacterium]|nr:hypothetical protein [Defluviitaleaceae bacterium]